MIRYIAKPGDSLSKIAQRHNVKDWRTLYDHPLNLDFKRKRPNPNFMQPGDVIVIPDGIAGVAGGGAPVRMITVRYQGRVESMPEKDFPAYRDEILLELRKSILLPFKQKAVEARSIYDHFREQNDDQYIVSWFVELTGQSLPPISVITEAESAARSVENAFNTKQFKQIQEAVRAGEVTVNRAVEALRKYRASMISGGENWLVGLQVTKGVSFAILGACVAASTGGSSLAIQASAAGGANLLQTVAEEGGKAVAGASDQTAATATVNMLTSFIAGFSVSRLTNVPAFKQFTANLASKIFAEAGDQIQKQVSKEAAEKLIQEWLESTGGGVLDETIKATGNSINQKQSLEQYCKTIADKLLTGGVKAKLANIVAGGAR